MKQKEKSKFRDSSNWKKFRIKLRDKSGGIDEITGLPLSKGSTVHHLDMRDEFYKDLSNEDNFVILNKRTHIFLHWIYLIYKQNPEVFDNFRNICEKMKSLEN